MLDRRPGAGDLTFRERSGAGLDAWRRSRCKCVAKILDRITLTGLRLVHPYEGGIGGLTCPKAGELGRRLGYLLDV